MTENNFKWSVIGHHNIIQYLQQNILNEQVAHAYLFFGPEHIGKAIVAENFIASLLCENLHQKNSYVPCHQCHCCQQVENKIHPDTLWVKREINEKTGKPRKNISIEQIRELQNRLHLHSFLNSYKTAVISEAESLTEEAANSLLKILEEPAPKTVIILLAKSIAALPQTIISRCQVLKFLPVAQTEILKYLIDQGLPRKKAKILAALAYGQPGIAINYKFFPDNFSDYQNQIKDFLSLHKLTTIERFKNIEKTGNFSAPDTVLEILNTWARVIRDLLLIKNYNQELINNSNFINELTELADLYNNKKLMGILKEINFARVYLRANVNPKLILENLILSLPSA